MAPCPWLLTGLRPAAQPSDYPLQRAGPYQECPGQHGSTIKEINPDWYTPKIALEPGVERAEEVRGACRPREATADTQSGLDKFKNLSLESERCLHPEFKKLVNQLLKLGGGIHRCLFSVLLLLIFHTFSSVCIDHPIGWILSGKSPAPAPHPLGTAPSARLFSAGPQGEELGWMGHVARGRQARWDQGGDVNLRCPHSKREMQMVRAWV